MTNTTNEDFVQLNPDDRKRLRDMIEEACGQMQMIKDKQSFIKDIKANAKETFGIPVTTMTDLVKTHFNDNYIEVATEREHFELYYESIFDDTPEDDV